MTRRQVWDRDEWTCQRCGTHKDLTVDHIVPVCEGGSNVLSNLQTLCAPCNGKKGPNRGRPKSERQRSVRLVTHVFPESRELYEKFAAEDGITVAEVMRAALKFYAETRVRYPGRRLEVR